MKIQFNTIKETTRYNDLFSLFTTNKIIMLIKLYQISQIENQRNGRTTAEVGTSREKDLSAFIKFFMKESVNININNENEEDIIVNERKISIKHSSNKSISQQSIKIIWTENKELQQKFIENCKFQCDMLIVYVRFTTYESGELEIIYIEADVLNKLKEESSNCIFKTRENSNGRGIEFTSDFFTKMKENVEFRCKVNFEKMIFENTDPITRRLKICDDMWYFVYEDASY